MRKFSVAVPMTGVFFVEVDAEDEEKAIDLAMQKDFKIEDLENWEIHRYIVRGNVFYGDYSEAEAEDIGPADE